MAILAAPASALQGPSAAIRSGSQLGAKQEDPIALRSLSRVRERKRRGTVSSPRHDNAGTAPIDIAAVPPRRMSGRSKRASYHCSRRRKLSSEQEAAIRSEAGNRTLQLAAAFGVSHETIRRVLRQEPQALVEMR